MSAPRITAYRLGPGSKGELRFQRRDLDKALVPVRPPAKTRRRFLRSLVVSRHR